MRKLCWFALPFCGATLAACLGLPFPVPIGLACIALGLLAGGLKRLPVCLACFGMALGLLWFQGYTALFRAPAQSLVGQTAPMQATVLTFPQKTSTGSFRAEVRLHLDNAVDPKLLLYADETASQLKPGDTITCTARFQRSDLVRGEHVSYYTADGIFLRGNAVTSAEYERPDHPPLWTLPVYAAQALKNSAATLFPTDVSGMMSALLTGDKSGILHSDYNALQRSGAAHIVAVSGLHVSFFASLLALLFRRRRLGAAVTVPLVFLYAAVAGFTPSVIRAAFMITMTLLAPLFGREEDRPTTLSLILLLLLVVNPYSIQSVSLQLSFGSVAGIHLVSFPLYRGMTGFLQATISRWRTALHRIYRVFASSLSVTLGAMLFTLPLTAIHFGSISLISPLTNLVTLWAVSATFYLILPLTVLGALVPGIPHIIALPASLLVRYILATARALSRLPFASLALDSFYLTAWLILICLLVLVIVLLRYRRPIIPICTGIVTLCAALLFHRTAPLSAPLSITVLDVGQGQCIVLHSGGRTALIDCGGNEGNAGDIAADHLQTLGISTLDLLILTHCHDDHANGVPELLERMEVSALVLPAVREDESAYREEILQSAQSKQTEITLLEQNRAITFGESTLTLYAPLGAGGTNEEGLFVLASCEDFDLLITGDANSFSESLLVKYAQLPDIEVLAAGHHGSRHSTSEVLLDAVTPETCLISSGYNTYGHPADETLARLAARGIDIYRTDGMGHLTIRYEGE